MEKLQETGISVITYLRSLSNLATSTDGLSWNIAFDYFVDSSNFTYWIVLFTSFACVVSLPGLKKRCRNLMFWRKRYAIDPQAFSMTHENGGQTHTAAATMVKPPAAKGNAIRYSSMDIPIIRK